MPLNRMRRDLSEIRAALSEAGTGEHCRCGILLVREHWPDRDPEPFPETCKVCGKPYGEDHPRLTIEIEVINSREQLE